MSNSVLVYPDQVSQERLKPGYLLLSDMHAQLDQTLPDQFLFELSRSGVYIASYNFGSDSKVTKGNISAASCTFWNLHLVVSRDVSGFYNTKASSITGLDDSLSPNTLEFPGLSDLINYRKVPEDQRALETLARSILYVSAALNLREIHKRYI